jgi:hypothetical protein
MTAPPIRSIHAAGVALGLIALVGIALSGAVLADHTTSEGNYTVEPHDSPLDRNPGATNATYHNWVRINGSVMPDAFEVSYDDGNLSTCTESDLRPFGIDRDGDDDGTTVDEDLSNRIEVVEADADRIRVAFLTSQEATVTLSADDELVAAFADCVDNPDEAGWYQLVARVKDARSDTTYRLTDWVGV